MHGFHRGFPHFGVYAQAFFFDRDDIAFKNVKKYFAKASDEERKHAMKLMEYQNMRGKHVPLRVSGVVFTYVFTSVYFSLKFLYLWLCVLILWARCPKRQYDNSLTTEVITSYFLRYSFFYAGGRIVLQPIDKPERDEWGSIQEAFDAALALEKKVNQSLLDIHRISSDHNDAQVIASCLNINYFHGRQGTTLCNALVPLPLK